MNWLIRQYHFTGRINLCKLPNRPTDTLTNRAEIVVSSRIQLHRGRGEDSKRDR